MLTSLSSMAPQAISAALAEARRACSPGGTVLCYEPRFANPFNRATTGVSLAALEASLGPATATARLTGFPPIARRLGRFTERLYPTLSRLAPTHRLSAHEPGGLPRRGG